MRVMMRVSNGIVLYCRIKTIFVSNPHSGADYQSYCSPLGKCTTAHPLRFIPYLLIYSVALFLKRHCKNRTYIQYTVAVKLKFRKDLKIVLKLRYNFENPKVIGISISGIKKNKIWNLYGKRWPKFKLAPKNVRIPRTLELALSVIFFDTCSNLGQLLVYNLKNLGSHSPKL